MGNRRLEITTALHLKHPVTDLASCVAFGRNPGHDTWHDAQRVPGALKTGRIITLDDCKIEKPIRIHHVHHLGLLIPILVITLYNTQGIYPNVSHTKTASYRCSILVNLWSPVNRDCVVMDMFVRLSRLRMFNLCRPTIAEIDICRLVVLCQLTVNQSDRMSCISQVDEPYGRSSRLWLWPGPSVTHRVRLLTLVQPLSDLVERLLAEVGLRLILNQHFLGEVCALIRAILTQSSNVRDAYAETLKVDVHSQLEINLEPRITSWYAMGQQEITFLCLPKVPNAPMAK